MENLYQPMTLQQPYFYQTADRDSAQDKQNSPNPANINQMFPGFGNYQTSFNPLPRIPYNGYDPKGMFKNNNFINQNNLLHNNLHTILLNEEIREYSVMIDSKDRNYTVYPDPFHYKVKFNPLPKSRERINGRLVVYEDANPVINENFTNVRYIKLEDIILPFFHKVRPCKTTIDDEIIEKWKVDPTRLLTDNLYTVLSIGKYCDINYRSTNDVLGNSFATIYYDNRINDTHFMGFTKNGLKIFQQDQLAKIDELKIDFMDPYGKPLCCDHVDPCLESCLECTCNDPMGDENTVCYRHNLFHPLNPIFQHHLHFKIGIVEPRLSKITFS